MSETFTHGHSFTNAPKSDQNKKVPAVSAVEFNKLRQNAVYMVLDAREADEFARSFIPGSLNIAASGSYALLYGLADFSQKLLLLCQPGREKETINRLAIVGYQNVVASLEGGIKTWGEAGLPLTSVPVISLKEVKDLLRDKIPVHIIELGNGEKKGTVLPAAISISLEAIESGLLRIDRSMTYFVVGETMNEAVFMVSVARTRGFSNLIPVNSGTRA